MTTPSPIITEVYATFVGAIDQGSLQRLYQGFAGTMTQGISKVHLLFQSTGGFVGDGVSLYNYLRVLPIDLTLYNTGTVASIATIAFLGAKKRKASAHAAFMIHRSTNSPQFASASRLQSAAKSLLWDDERTEAILREHTTLTVDHWKEIERHDLTLSAKEAVEVGLADEVAEWAPPAGTQILNV